MVPSPPRYIKDVPPAGAVPISPIINNHEMMTRGNLDFVKFALVCTLSPSLQFLALAVMPSLILTGDEQWKRSMLLSWTTKLGIWSLAPLQPTWSLVNGYLSTNFMIMGILTDTKPAGYFTDLLNDLALIMMKLSALWIMMKLSALWLNLQ